MRRRDFMKMAAGSAAAWPLAARSQQSDNIRRIGILASLDENDPEVQSWIGGFKRGLQELNWSDGRNVRIDYRFGGSNSDRLRAFARDLVASQTDVILAAATLATSVMRQESRRVPVVFVQVPDPVELGIVASLARPGGNFTGFTNFEFAIGGKWLEVLKECAPDVSRVVAILDPENPSGIAYLRALEAAAPSFGIQLTTARVRNAGEIERAIDIFARGSNGSLVVLPSPIALRHREQISSLAVCYRLPAVYPYRPYIVSGGLISYGVDVPDLYRRAASYVDRILKGEKPADLPVQAPTKYELVINLQTAKAIGLAVPWFLQQRADEVIE